MRSLTHSPAEMGVTAGRFDRGIPIWPYHAALTTAGLLRLLSGFVVMRYHRARSRFGNHRRLRVVGDTFIITGLSMSICMVRLSGARHLHCAHGIPGAGTIALTMITLAPGLVITGRHGVGRSVRRMHRYIGGIAIALGFSMLPRT